MKKSEPNAPVIRNRLDYNRNAIKIQIGEFLILLLMTLFRGRIELNVVKNFWRS